MRLARQATKFSEGDYVRQKADDQEPQVALDGQQDAPAKNGANQQIRKNRQQKIHWSECSSTLPTRKSRFLAADDAIAGFYFKASHEHNVHNLMRVVALENDKLASAALRRPRH